MTGRDVMFSLSALYDVAGQIRAAFIELQAEVRTMMEASDAQGR
jgi:hypothetical protein